MPLICEPNRIEWEAGDYVIHDSDAKRADMLVVVIGWSRDGGFRPALRLPIRVAVFVATACLAQHHPAAARPRALQHRSASYAVAASFNINPSNT